MKDEFGLTVIEAELKLEFFFNGTPSADTAVQFYGLIGSQLSFENVATQIAAQLIERFPSVAVHDYRFRQSRTDGPFASRAFLTRDAPVAVYHGVAYRELKKELSEHRFKIGCFVCDADVVPPDEVDVCNFFDLVVVPSVFCRDVFQRSGVKRPILIVPHGVTDDFAPAAGTSRPDVFTFYNIFAATRNFRKSGSELVQCFVRAFDRDPAYRLRLRTRMTESLQQLLEDERAAEVVTVDPEPLADDIYVRRFSEVHATVHPSKAEGFGMVPLQSLVCETPVIAPAVTGLADYLSVENALLLKTNGTVPAQADAASKYGGRYPAIDEGDLVQCLREMADNWDREQQKAAAAAPGLRARYSWEAVTAPLLEVIQRQLDKPGSSIQPNPG